MLTLSLALTLTFLAHVPPLLAAGMLQGFGDLLVGVIVLALAAYGGKNGLFLAVIAGMHALVSLVVALAFAELLAGGLVGVELPVLYAFPAAFGLLLIGTAFGIQLAMGAYVPQDVLRFAPLIDKLGGGLVGAVAGIVVAGTMLIAASIAPVPAEFQIDGTKLRYDLGTKMLKTFARCVEPDDAKRVILLDGEPGSVPQPPSPAVEFQDGGSADKPGKNVKPATEVPPPPPPPPQASEPFADLNGNKTYDEGEPYLDTDSDTAFTLRLDLNDPNGNGKRDIGLLERYRMHAWGQHVISAVPIDEIIVAADGQSAAAAVPPGAEGAGAEGAGAEGAGAEGAEPADKSPPK